MPALERDTVTSPETDGRDMFGVVDGVRIFDRLSTRLSDRDTADRLAAGLDVLTLNCCKPGTMRPGCQCTRPPSRVIISSSSGPPPGDGPSRHHRDPGASFRCARTTALGNGPARIPPLPLRRPLAHDGAATLTAWHLALQWFL
jgi:hypothetical protein